MSARCASDRPVVEHSEALSLEDDFGQWHDESLVIAEEFVATIPSV